MSQFLTLLKLEFLSKFQRFDKGAKLYSRIFKICVYFLGLALISSLILFAFSSVIRICNNGNLNQEFLIFFILIIQLIQFLFGLSLTTKTLFNSQDSDILKLPVSGTKIFFVKMTFVYIYELAMSVLLTLPVLIMFGIMTGQGALFYVMLFPVMFLLPLFPFLLSLILSIPTIYFVSFLKNKFVIMLVLYTLFVAAGFLIYIYGLKFIMTLINTENIDALLSSAMVMKIKGFAFYFFLQVLLKNILIGNHFFYSLVINLSIAVLLIYIVIIFAKKIYIKILLDNIENKNFMFSKKSEIKEMSTSRALFSKEFLSVFRSVNYSFQYLTIVITTPLMVYFSNVIVSGVGFSGINAAILPGICVLVLIMFLSMGASFSATSITREGGNFFHTKFIPVSYKKQVVVKFLFHLLVAVPAVFISCFILALAGFISYVDMMLMGLSISMIIAGNIAYGIMIDIRRPKFSLYSNKEITGVSSNVNATLSLGFMIAIIIGICSIIISYLFSLPMIYIVLFGFSIPYLVIECFMLMRKLEDRYRRIEV